jgi:hypothetical protein
MLPSFTEERPGGVALELWRLFPLVEEAADVPALMRAIGALRV